MAPLSANSKDNKLLGRIEVSHEEGWYQTGGPREGNEQRTETSLEGFSSRPRMGFFH